MLKNTLIAAFIAACIALLVCRFELPTGGQNTVGDPVLDRVEQKGEVRCGYVNNPPFVSIDPNTHALSGIMIDITDKIGEIAGWKIDWSAETTYPNMAEDLARGKFDVFCGGSWPIAFAEKRQWWAGPLFYSGVGVFARANDTRFDDTFDLHMFDSPDYSISVIDGVAVDRVRMMEFPHARTVSLPSLSNYGEMITQVVDGKADVVLIEQETAYRYMRENPGKIKRVGGGKTLRYYGIGYEFSFDAPRLRNVFETASRELVDGGDVDRILTKYETAPGMFYRVRSPIVENGR